MRIGLIGVGRIGAHHARTLAALDGVGQVVVADADAARADALAAGMAAGVTSAPVVDVLRRGAVDGVVIAASTAAHTELLMAAVGAGVPAFCEKPVAPDIAGTIRVRDAIMGAETLVQMGFQRRFDEGHVAVRAAVADGSLGWLHAVRSQTLDPAPPPAAYIATSGGIFRDCCVHDFDAIRWVTGREIAEVCATGANRGAAFFAAAGDVATAAAILTLDDGTFGHVAASRYNASGYDVRFEALGSAGSVVAGVDPHTPVRAVGREALSPAGPAYSGFADRFAAAYVAELETFVGLIGSRGQSPCTVDDALAATYVAEAAELSRHERRTVSVSDVTR